MTQAAVQQLFKWMPFIFGIGFIAPLWQMQADLLSKTSALITGCDCDNGCPMCVGPIGETGPLAKTVALRILQHLLAAVDDGVKASLAETTNEEVPF